MADVANSNLLETIEGIQSLKGALVVLVKTEWNAAIIDELERGCRQVFDQNGIRCRTLVVPGAVEIPFAVRQASEALPEAAAFIALGCVIRGDTPHFEYVCQAVTQGITSLNLSLSVPVIFGVLTVNSEEQARERIGGRHGHKGVEAAVTALKMMALQQQLNS